VELLLRAPVRVLLERVLPVPQAQVLLAQVLPVRVLLLLPVLPMPQWQGVHRHLRPSRSAALLRHCPHRRHPCSQ
jgi:hypothetical protein